ncbi:hypothetical protein PTSG_07776 [Salpingoeca rosetta]|uniref:Uncharacterized protein n=1 Tax=Salpingoeca rosetta (strain ATCC 50818 / BSB-021) TaxID=946362 RepID=F2UGA8_SALR5|nr:uncharacterized protein PTSG_07776 [Salpingoeca rosetta]EGD75658.1 hypothetical protein PTSG_07776 [Salpingoeca rosetta]|eukprot:XP_004991579.1 hypothetical protein PTSG_07776 [Salpingoeca rosetta]
MWRMGNTFGAFCLTLLESPPKRAKTSVNDNTMGRREGLRPKRAKREASAAADAATADADGGDDRTHVEQAQVVKDGDAGVVRTAKQLWKTADVKAWRAAEDGYEAAINAVATKKKKKHHRLLELDAWMWTDLRPAAMKRDKPHVTKPELEKIMEWKITRGKFRPLMRLVKQNDEQLVIDCSTAALAAMPNVEKAINHLTKLKGVGPATASAVLAPLDPRAPFMSDEAMLAIPSCQPIDYKLRNYLHFVKHIQAKAKELGNGWTCERVGRALWAKHYNPEAEA